MRGAQELRVKESDRIAGVVEGLRGLGADIEATEDGFAVRGTGGLRGGTIDARGDHRLAMMGAVAGLASREGVEVIGMDAAAVSYPGFVGPEPRESRLCSISDRRTRRRRQVDRRPRARARARLHLPRQRRDVPLRGAARARVARSRSPAALARGARIELDGARRRAPRVLLDGRDVSDADPHPRGLRGGLAGGRRPAACARRSWQSSAR